MFLNVFPAEKYGDKPQLATLAQKQSTEVTVQMRV